MQRMKVLRSILGPFRVNIDWKQSGRFVESQSTFYDSVSCTKNADDRVRLQFVVLRPAMVYGKGDLTSLTPRLAVAAVYKHIKEKMKLLWTKDLQVNCVHADDMVRAAWVACKQIAPGTTLNLADSSKLDQGKLNSLLEQIFGIETGFLGSIVSNLAKLNFEGVVAVSNDKHVPAWQALCSQHNISNTPVSPYLVAALLKCNHLAVDGSMITRVSNFTYSKPTISAALLREQMDAFVEQRLFPRV
jgi:hypothetical protein